MAGKIFVNYRRDDSAANALNVAQYLEREFGAGNVFIDIDRMRAGEHFPSVLKSKLNQCRVMIVVIGPSWLTLKDEHGVRRIDDPEDWVRMEIASALTLKKVTASIGHRVGWRCGLAGSVRAARARYAEPRQQRHWPKGSRRRTLSRSARGPC